MPPAVPVKVCSLRAVYTYVTVLEHGNTFLRGLQLVEIRRVSHSLLKDSRHFKVRIGDGGEVCSLNTLCCIGERVKKKKIKNVEMVAIRGARSIGAQ